MGLKSSLPSAMPRLSPGWVMVMASPLSMASLLPASTPPTSPSPALLAMYSWASVRLRPSPTPPFTLSTPLVPGTDTPPTDSDKSSSTPQTLASAPTTWDSGFQDLAADKLVIINLLL